MWTRTYLILLMVRLYFAISPSYIHPDENFQGPEVIAGKSASSLFLYLAFLYSVLPSEGLALQNCSREER